MPVNWIIQITFLSTQPSWPPNFSMPIFTKGLPPTWTPTRYKVCWSKWRTCRQWCWQRLKMRIIYGRRIYSNYYYRSSSSAGIHKRCQPSDVLYWPFYRSFVTCRHAPATAAAITSLRIFFKGDMIPMITAKLIPQLWLMTTRWISHLHFPTGSHRIGNWMFKGIFIGCLPLSVNQRTAAAAGGSREVVY